MKIKVQLLIMLLCMLAFDLSAHDFEVGGIYYEYNNGSDGGAVSVTYKGSQYYSFNNEYYGNVIIPASVTYNGKTYSVTSIFSGAFRECSSVTSVTIPNSVTSIGEFAFSGTAWYDNQPNGLIYIGNIAYEYKGTMPDNTSITIKEGTVSISPYAFLNCSGLTSVNIPNSITFIGERAFKGCGLTSVTIPNSVTSIRHDAFENCCGLTSVEFHCPLIGSWFSGNTSIEQVLIGEEVTSIGYSAFKGCSGITAVTIPNSVTSIGDEAFYYCSGLTSVTIGNSVTSIGSYAFYFCSGLTSVTIPNSVTSIGNYAFEGCSGLTSVKFHCPLIGSWFSGNTSIEQVLIGEEVTSIGYSAFKGCSGITAVTIPNSVTSIGDEAFYYCSGLTSVTIGNSVTSIVGNPFYGCSGLTSINVPVTDYAAFCNNKVVGLIGNSIGKPVLLIDEKGNEIKNFVVPNSVTSIGDGAFKGCTGLTSVTIPNSVTFIGSGAFYNCSGLTSVTIPNSVTSIGDGAFKGCTGLTSVTIPNSVTSIGNYAFSFCI